MIFVRAMVNNVVSVSNIFGHSAFCLTVIIPFIFNCFLNFGFSATLFQDKTTKEYVFAIKGSKGTYDLAIADAGDIANDGFGTPSNRQYV